MKTEEGEQRRKERKRKRKRKEKEKEKEEDEREERERRTKKSHPSSDQNTLLAHPLPGPFSPRSIFAALTPGSWAASGWMTWPYRAAAAASERASLAEEAGSLPEAPCVHHEAHAS